MTSTTTALSSLLSPQVLCFDVYGTLIDWETGLHTAATKRLLSQLPTPPSRDEFLKAYLSYEAAQQRATPDMTYSSLLAAVYRQLVSHYSLDASSESESEAVAAATAFGASVGHWPAFADSPAALAALGKRFKLVVLSNVDRDSFQGSLPSLSESGGDGEEVFDLVLTAQDVGSYKPSLRNFEFMLREVHDRWGIDKDRVCVVANSLFHDHVPAKRLGLQSVWIERPGAVMGVDTNTPGASWDWSFKTLGEMAQSVENLAQQLADA